MFHNRFAALVILMFCCPLVNDSKAQAVRPEVQVTAADERPETLQVFMLRYASAREIQRIIGDLNEQLRSSFDHRTNALIVIVPADDLDAFKALVEQLDVPTRNAPQQADKEGDLAEFRTRIDQLERELERIKADLSTAPSPSIVSNPIDTTATLTKRKPVAPVGTVLRVAARGPQGRHTVVAVVPEGTHVRKGEVVLEVDTKPIEQRIQMHKTVMRRARATVVKSKAELENKRLQAQSQLDEAESNLSLATVGLREFREGTFALERKVHETEIQQAKRRLEKQAERVDAGLGDVESLQDLKENLELAEQRLHVYREFTAPKLDNEFEMLVSSAKREIQIVRSEVEAEVQAARATLASQEARVQQAEAQLKGQQDELAQCKLVAPHDGVVAAGPQPIVVGSVLREGQIALVLIPVDEDGPDH